MIRTALLATSLSQSDTVSYDIPPLVPQHVSRFMTVWLLLLPLAIAPHMGWYAVPAMALIAFAVVGVDEITHQARKSAPWHPPA